jgi:squalene synthase HpnC
MHQTLEKLAKTHYENFPVGSRFVPRKYREAIHLIYTFARVADDIADEGMLSSIDRIQQLNDWEDELLSALDGNQSNIYFSKLADEIRKRKLPVSLFQDLIKAFRQDVNNPMYSKYTDVLEYCRYSAHPVGRLMLRIFECGNDENDHLSDCICTALQLTNFWQDINVDSQRNRFYIPTEDLLRFQVSKEDILNRENRVNFPSLLKFEVERTLILFEEGKPLITKVHADLQFELKLIWVGGMKILEKIEKINYDTRVIRPKITKVDAISIFTKALLS